MSLTGTWPRSLDEKGRFAVPKRVRDELGGETLTELVIAPWMDKSLALFTPVKFAAIAERFGEKSAKADVRNYMRLLYAQAEHAELDSQGRIRVPERLKKFADLNREVVLLGVNDHAEIWDVARWEKYIEDLDGQFDTIAEQAYL
jgi:MraZ protein